MIWNQEIVLQNSIVTLRPMTDRDAERLAGPAADEAIWRYMVVRAFNAAEREAYIKEALRQRAAGVRYTFVVEDKQGSLIGASAFGNYSAIDQRIEIGWTWLASTAHGRGINSNAKSLMMRHAFEELGMERVEFKTDVLNLRARAALIKIGAQEEGVLRSHTLMPDGRRRDTIYYSVLRHEWPAVQAMHVDKLGVPELPAR